MIEQKKPNWQAGTPMPLEEMVHCFIYTTKTGYPLARVDSDIEFDHSKRMTKEDIDMAIKKCIIRANCIAAAPDTLNLMVDLRNGKPHEELKEQADEIHERMANGGYTGYSRSKRNE